MRKKILIFFFVFTVTGLGLVTAGCSEDGYGQHDHAKMLEESGQAEDQGICPVMGGKSSKDYSYAYRGKTYYFCCPGCIDTFKQDPEKYISRIKKFDLEAFQFGYSPDRIEVKKGDIVRIFATSRDVPHGIYIKKYEIKTTVKKEEIEKIEFIADKAGEFPILCSVYCGRGHRDMKATLVVNE